jgi:hypothetical protein
MAGKRNFTLKEKHILNLHEGHDINYLALSGVLAVSGNSSFFFISLINSGDASGYGETNISAEPSRRLCRWRHDVCAWNPPRFDRTRKERTRASRGCKHGRFISVILPQYLNLLQVSGTRYMASFPLMHSLIPVSPLFARGRGENQLDGGAPYYDVYTCKDGGWMSVGCIEPKFFKEFITKFTAALPKDFTITNGWRPLAGSQHNAGEWPQLKQFITEGFLTNTRDYWTGVFHGEIKPSLTPNFS